MKRLLYGFVFLACFGVAVAQQGSINGPLPPCSAFGTIAGTCLQGGTALPSAIFPASQTYSASITAQTPGITPPTFTVNTQTYWQYNKLVTLVLSVTVTAAGTGSNGVLFSLPVTGLTGKNGSCSGREDAVTTGVGLVGAMVNGGTGIINLATGLTPIVLNYQLDFTCTYIAS